MLGSNIGIESTFFALTFPDVQVYGYDLLCAFVDRAKSFKVRNGWGIVRAFVFHSQNRLLNMLLLLFCGWLSESVWR